jgi:hypothetical protein
MATTTYNPRTKEEQKGTDPLEQAKEVGAEAMTKAKEVGKDALSAAKEVGADALGKAKEAVSSVGDMATQAASTVGNKADDLTAAAGHEIREFGRTVAKKAPHDGMTGAASQAVAEGIKGSGRYIEEAKLSGMAHDVEQVIKNHPIPALLACLGIGFCLGRAMRD